MKTNPAKKSIRAGSKSKAGVTHAVPSAGVPDTEAALRASESRYRRLFQTAQDGILILDISTKKIIDANPFMTHLLGYAYSDIVGKELWKLGFARDKAASQAKYAELEAVGYIRYEHLNLETKSGQEAEVEFVSNVYEDNGKRVAQCNVRDISARSRMERTVKDQAEQLAALDIRKDEFLAMLSHELRNPLAPILNAVTFLHSHHHENPQVKKSLGIIERQVGQLKHIVDDLLEVSRITSGRMQLRVSRVAVSGIVEHALETARPLIEQHNHSFLVSMASEPVYVRADGARLQQVVVNLLNNACKYTADGGHIWLTVRHENDECVIRVRDDGVGIGPDLLPTVFDLFTQSDRSLDRSQGGLGVGLALVKRLVEMHHGSVEAHSVVGEGSEFVVRIPVSLAPAGADDEAPLASLAVLPKQRVLIVEDNVDSANSLGMLLEAAGFEVQIAHDGQAALQIALEYRPNVVLLDIGLPGLDGYKVAKWMRHTLKNILLIAVTGYGNDADIHRSKEAGFDHHIIKPANFKVLRQILVDEAR